MTPTQLTKEDTQISVHKNSVDVQNGNNWSYWGKLERITYLGDGPVRASIYMTGGTWIEILTENKELKQAFHHLKKNGKENNARVMLEKCDGKTSLCEILQTHSQNNHTERNSSPHAR